MTAWDVGACSSSAQQQQHQYYTPTPSHRAGIGIAGTRTYVRVPDVAYVCVETPLVAGYRYVGLLQDIRNPVIAP